jgi:hypothetical protein
MDNIVPRFVDLDGNLIDEFNTSLEFGNLYTKSHPLLKNWPLDLMGEFG